MNILCGIVLAGAAFRMGNDDVSLFEKLLLCDTFRGAHSTGVMSGYHINGNDSVYVDKIAVDGPSFLKSETWLNSKSRLLETVYVNNVVSKVLKTPHFLVGHNRYATMGAKTTANAHPFSVGAVTLVHNGTLKNQSLLPDHTEFEVDSHNIAHAINKEGIEETLTKLHGAFTLIWHDARDNTVNIIRNSDRPFHLARTTSNDWFGASEEDMLMWILRRDSKYGMYKKTDTVAEHFECEVGVQYVFDTSGGKFRLKEQIVHELPKFVTVYPTVNRSRYVPIHDSYYDHYNDYGNTVEEEAAAARRKAAAHSFSNSLLSRVGLKTVVGDPVKFTAFSFMAYTRSQLGLMEGYVDEIHEFVSVKAHAVADDLYESYEDYVGTISNVYETNGTVTIVVGNAKKFDKEEQDAAEEDDETLVVLEDGATYSKRSWDKSKECTCDQCLTHIPFSEAGLASASAQGYTCWQCVAAMDRTLADNGFALLPAPKKDKYPDVLQTFTCEGCKEDFPFSAESDFLTGHCEDCATEYYTAKESKTLDDGSVVSESEWSEVNTCSQCGHLVEWENADKCSVVGPFILCMNCL